MPSFPAGDKLLWNEASYRELSRGPRGPVVRDLSRRGIRVEAAAKNFASGNNGGPKVRTGRLRSSISWAIGEDVIGPYVDIGTNVEYALPLELGRVGAKAYPFLRPALPAGI